MTSIMSYHPANPAMSMPPGTCVAWNGAHWIGPYATHKLEELVQLGELRSGIVVRDEAGNVRQLHAPVAAVPASADDCVAETGASPWWAVPLFGIAATALLLTGAALVGREPAKKKPAVAFTPWRLLVDADTYDGDALGDPHPALYELGVGRPGRQPTRVRRQGVVSAAPPRRSRAWRLASLREDRRRYRRGSGRVRAHHKRALRCTRRVDGVEGALDPVLSVEHGGPGMVPRRVGRARVDLFAPLVPEPGIQPSSASRRTRSTSEAPRPVRAC
jgi:hypothetical protein